MSGSTRTGGRDATKGTITGRIALSVGRTEMPQPIGFTWRALSDVARLESGHTPSRSKSEYWGGSVPWIGIRDATANHGKVIQDTLDHVTQAGLDNSSARLLPADTVCLSRTASVGYVVQTSREMATSQDFVNWVCGPELNPTYLRYVLMLEQTSVRRFAHGTTHQTMYYPEAKALHALLPSRPMQDAIAEVLGALDDKIAANDEVLRISDHLVRARFDSLGGDSAENLPISAVADNVRIQVDPSELDPSVPYVGLEHVPRRSMWMSDIGVAGSVSSAKARFRTGDVLFGKLRPYFHKVVRADRDGIASTDILVVRAKDPTLAGFVLAAASSDAAIRATSAAVEGTRMPRTKWADLAAVTVPWPGEAAAIEFSSRVAVLCDQAAALQQESRVLAEARDELLPLLMSGKVRVRDAEKRVEEVL